MRHHSPSVKNAVHCLRLRRRDSHRMHSTMKILLFLPAEPFRKRFSYFKISLLRVHPINHLDTIVSSDYIVFPHVESELQLSAPEIR